MKSSVDGGTHSRHHDANNNDAKEKWPRARPSVQSGYCSPASSP